jgi:hypothetical protein
VTQRVSAITLTVWRGSEKATSETQQLLHDTFFGRSADFFQIF